MPEPIGILVEHLTLQKTLHGLPTHERLSLYRDIAVSEGYNLVLFSINDINVRSNRILGHVPSSQGWQRVIIPIPKVVHKRALYKKSKSHKVLRRLHRRGTIFVNPYLMQDKRSMYDLLKNVESVRHHLPQTWHYSWRRVNWQLNQAKSVILKPTIGSVGQGVLRIVPLPGQRAELTGALTHILSRASVRKRLRNRISPRHYLLQQCINLAHYNGKPFDLRVPVQRDGTGAWTTPGMVAKVAVRHPFLTNIAQGGYALPGEIALNEAFSPTASSVVQSEIKRLAIDVAQSIAAQHPHAADLGLDIGVDTDGKPWLIEVNTRDQRITFDKACMHEELRTLYKNPIAFCTYLATTMSLH